MASVFIDKNKERASLERFSIRPKGHDWYIVSSNGVADSDRYLHRDGIWRHSTKNAGIWSGYYPSQQAAEDMAKSLGLEYTVRTAQ